LDHRARRPQKLSARFSRLFVLILFWIWMAPVHAKDPAAAYPQIREFFPQADRIGEFEGQPRAAPVFRGERVLGYVFLTNDVLRIPAYSGEPIDNLVGFDLSGHITGLAIVHHEEPILAVGITAERLKRFVDQYLGKSVFDRISVGAKREGYVQVDAITGATITVMVENATLMRSARMVAESRGITPATAAPVVDAPPAAQPRSVPPAPPAEEPMWVWKARKLDVTAFILFLAIVTAVYASRDKLVRRSTRKDKRWVEIPRYLIWATSVGFVGFYAMATPSITHVLTWFHSVVYEWRWELFLSDPLIFIFWWFIIITIFIWGRGLFCGWLCPYGALAELAYKVAGAIGLKRFQFHLPIRWHNKLKWSKYAIFVALVAVSFYSIGSAQKLAEVEPFKSTFLVGGFWNRAWPFVLYWVALFGVSLFIERPFCKYLCPLGAGLAIPTTFRAVPLKRKAECGNPCQACAKGCSALAINKAGRIDQRECLLCLECQILYYDDHSCPPLSTERRRRAKAGLPLTPIGADGYFIPIKQIE
jgi:hypothetical protein